jgi:hypothetical protein
VVRVVFKECFHESFEVLEHDVGEQTVGVPENQVDGVSLVNVRGWVLEEEKVL